MIRRLGKTAFSQEMLGLVLMFVLSVGVYAAYVSAHLRTDKAHERRHESFLISSELRQSSVDMTRMVRTFVVSGDPRYKQHYQEIVDIQNGVRSRPVDYQKVYWDLVLDDDVRPRPDSGQKISLLEMMRQAGFTPQEFALLAEAKTNSDKLSQLEFEAIRLREVTGKEADASRERAEAMLHDAAYHQAKADIMRPIAEFETLVDTRTRNEVESSERLSLVLRLVMMALIVVLMVSMWRTYRALIQTLGSSVEEVKDRIDRIASGDLVLSAVDDSYKQNTVSGWLTAMQKKLYNSTLQQQELTRRLSVEKERAQVTLSSIGDAVITTDAKGNVTFLNAVATKLTGWSPEEAEGKSLTEVFHIVNESTRLTVENPVVRVLKDGSVVSLTNHTVLIARDGIEYNIEDSAAPIYLDNGELLGCVLVFHDVTEKHRLMRDVRWQAGHDVLTGLPNRALLADRFERALLSVQRQHDSLAVCLLDLDDFKPVNDLHGHEVGDRLLVKAAQRLSEMVRSEDTVARLGGDEFVLLLGGVHGREETEASLRRILTAMTTPYEIDDKNIQVSASIGVVLYPYDDADADTLLRHADQAMYQAKQAGRNRYHFFDVEKDKEIQTTHQTLSRVRAAMESSEFCLHYQPKVNMRSGVVVGMEALLRWQHPQHGLLLPASFLPALESTDLVVGIGEWVLDNALRQIVLWKQQGMSMPVSVNIAARHFQNPEFLSHLKDLLARHAEADPKLLQIEILESAAQRDIEQVRTLIMQCQALGVSFALDDFGTGYSSLNYLKHLPVDTLKIDQSFVRDILDDQGDLALVEAIISLANVFERGVIAEGVETSEHGLLLMRMGCDVAQGHAIALAMPAARVQAWCAQFIPDEQWLMWADVAWHLDDFPLMVAALDHKYWVEQIARAVEDASLQFISRQLLDHHRCRFGQWYYGKGNERYGHLHEFGELQVYHVQVHRVGTEVVRLRDAGDTAGAKARLQELFVLRDRILTELKRLQMTVARIG